MRVSQRPSSTFRKSSRDAVLLTPSNTLNILQKSSENCLQGSAAGHAQQVRWARGPRETGPHAPRRAPRAGAKTRADALAVTEGHAARVSIKSSQNLPLTVLEAPQTHRKCMRSTEHCLARAPPRKPNSRKHTPAVARAGFALVDQSDRASPQRCTVLAFAPAFPSLMVLARHSGSAGLGLQTIQLEKRGSIEDGGLRLLRSFAALALSDRPFLGAVLRAPDDSRCRLDPASSRSAASQAGPSDSHRGLTPR